MLKLFNFRSQRDKKSFGYKYLMHINKDWLIYKVESHKNWFIYINNFCEILLCEIWVSSFEFYLVNWLCYYRTYTSVTISYYISNLFFLFNFIFINTWKVGHFTNHWYRFWNTVIYQWIGFALYLINLHKKWLYKNIQIRNSNKVFFFYFKCL